jgi:hypothetical protein
MEWEHGRCGNLEDLLLLGRRLDGPSPIDPKLGMSEFMAAWLLRVRDRRGKQVRLRANRAQREFERRRGQSNIVLKARQMGISTWVAGRFFLKTITHPGTLTVQVAHTQEAAESIFACVHRFVGGLPASLRNGALRTARASSRQIVFPALDSEYRVETAGDRNAGRGVTIQNLHCSEVARWPGDANETLAGLRAALPATGELVLESTPNGADGCFYEEWQRSGGDADQLTAKNPVSGSGTEDEAGAEDSPGADAAGPEKSGPEKSGPEKSGTGGEAAPGAVRSTGAEMVRHFLPWWFEPEYTAEPVPESEWTAEERKLNARAWLNGGQIGFRRRMEAGFRGLARQEYAEDADECFLSSGDCVFDLKLLDARLRELTEPPVSRDGGELLVWYPAVAGREYLIAVDPAGGGAEGDFSAAQVLEAGSGLQCAELRGKLGTLELARRAAALGREYGAATLVVERNNHGSGVLAYLKSVCRYPRIFAQDGQDGWLTSSLSRPRMIGALASALVERPGLFHSRRLLRECRTFVRLRNGRTGAQAGAHDDCVMAMAIGLAARADALTRPGLRRAG